MIMKFSKHFGKWNFSISAWDLRFTMYPTWWGL